MIMTSNEAAQFIREMKVKYISATSTKVKDFDLMITVFEMAEHALKEMENKSDRALTLEEFKRMEGQPVFIQQGDGEEYWGIFDELYDLDDDFYRMMHPLDPCGHFGLHLLGWRAFLRMPHLPEGELK